MSIEYKDFEVELSICVCGEKEVRVLDSPIDRPRERFLPDTTIDGLESLIQRYSDMRKEGQEDWGEGHELAVSIGKGLYHLLLPGALEDTFKNSLTNLDSSGGQDGQPLKGLRIRLSFGDPESYQGRAGSLPWELLCDPKTRRFFGREPRTPIVRYLDLSRVIHPLTTPPPLKILAVLPSPKHDDLHPIDKKAHIESLKAAVKKQKWLRIKILEGPASLENIRDTLDEHQSHGRPFHVLHFLGHGIFSKGKDGALVFETKDEKPRFIRGEDLARHLSAFRGLRLVVLAACSGANMPRQDGKNPFTGAASALIAGGMQAVVAMQFPITETAARHFTAGFYKRLGQNRPVDEALMEGRSRIVDEDPESVEWATPVLFLRSKIGQILDIREDDVPEKRIAVFNVKDHGWLEVVDELVDLREYFNDRYIKRPSYWNGEVLEALQSVFNSNLVQGVHYRVAMAAPISVAFAAGYLLGVHSGFKISFEQRTGAGTFRWHLGEQGSGYVDWLGEKESDKTLRKFPLTRSIDDLAVLVSPTRWVVPGVKSYLESSGPGVPIVGKAIHACFPRESHTSIADGAHAEFLAQSLANRIDRYSSGHGRGTLHLFMAGPLGLAFALGRLCRTATKIQLYEYDKEGLGSGTYAPSITLVPDGMASVVLNNSSV